MKRSGTMLPVDRPNVDTDQIIPAGYLTTISKKGLGVHLFEGLPNSPLGQEPWADASVILTRQNFGCGSSREHAAWAILDAGFHSVIAAGFARIFEDNCYNNGIVPVALDDETVERLFQAVAADAAAVVEIDVEAQTVSCGEIQASFDLDPLKKEFILRGGFLKYMQSVVGEVREFDKNRQTLY